MPLLVKPSQLDGSKSYFSVNKQFVVLETVKKAEDSNNTLIVRLYEAHGGRGNFRLESPLPVKSVKKCQLLEVESGDNLNWENGGANLFVKPFEILTLKLQF